MSDFLCYTKNKQVDVSYCVNECKYIFKNDCSTIMAYKQGRADSYIEMVELKHIILTRPRYMSATRYLGYLQRTFPLKWLFGWNDADCKTYKLIIPTVKENKNDV